MNLSLLSEAFPDRHILYYDSVDSTQHMAEDQPIGTIVLADCQSEGQGRHGHSWYSEARNGIYCTFVLEPTPLLTLALGVAAVDAIALSTGILCDIRWPNDLLIDGRKVAGILVQLVEGKAIAGIGINVNHTSFPEGMEAASLWPGPPMPPIPREQILLSLIPAVDSIVQEDSETILRLFAHASSYVWGRRVTVDHPDGAFSGTTAGLDPAGYLMVQKDDGTDTLILAGGVRAAGS